MSPTKTFYQTTPIYYVNDVPHVGHAYTTLLADALARARRLAGHEVFFLTGTDEHGQNIERIARARGVPEQDYCDDIAGRFKELWKRLDVEYDGFIRTTDERHRRGVLALWARLREAHTPGGEPAVYKGRYTGWYCPRCEAFKTEDELAQPDRLCPEHERPCEWTEEDNYFFRLSAYAEWLEQQIRSDKIAIAPRGRRNEVLAVLRQGLQDFSISRARVKWGIPVPEEPTHVFYVWMDALANYITALGFDTGDEVYRKFWQEADERLHFMGKEIIRFHCLYWPAMLHAADLPIPTRIFAHGWLTKHGKKLSKTTGNIIDPEALLDRWGPDPVRYFFLREGAYGQDWDYTDDAFVRRYNADLANDLGNLVSRALTMARRYCGGAVPPRPARVEQAAGFEETFETDAVLDGPVGGLCRGVLDRYQALDYAGALSELWNWIAQLNQRIVARAPWELAKDPARREELENFLYRLLEAIRVIAVLLWPVMPRAARRLQVMMGLPESDPRQEDLKWGRLEPQRALGEIEPLFPRVETKSKRSSAGETKRPNVSSPKAEFIERADFQRLDLRVARIVAAEPIPKARKLLRLRVELGDETRQVVAGIAETYSPEELVGRTVVLVANLKPARLMGVESQGMVLAATVDGKVVLCGFDQAVPSATQVK